MESNKPSFDSVEESNPNKPSLVERMQSTNEAGGGSFDPFSDEFGLYKVVINNLLEDTHYDDADESFDKVWQRFDEVADANPEFVLQLAVYARQEEGFRDIPQLLLVLAANDERTQPYVRDYTPAIIDRTDEFNSVLSYQLRGYGKPVPKPLKKGMTNALHKRYQIVQVSDEDGNEIGTERVTFIEEEHDSLTDDEWTDGEATTHWNEDAAHARAIESVTGDDISGFSGTTKSVDRGYLHDTYTAKKYLQRNKEVSLFDVINLTHPNPRSDNRDELFGRIVKGELDDHEDVDPLREDRTWEATRSDDEDDRSEAEQWRDRLDDMGLMARVRNLRNMREAGLSGREIFDYDVNEVGPADGARQPFGPESESIVRNSKMFPFRFYQAFVACNDQESFGSTHRRHKSRAPTFTIGAGSLLDDFSEQWMNEAIDVSTQNLPDSLENTFTSVDLSGSMDANISENSVMSRAEIGSLFGAMLLKRDSDAGAFGDKFVTFEVEDRARESNSTLELAEKIYEASDAVGNSTNGWKTLRWATQNDVEYDRFVVFTDEQIWDSTTMFRSSTTLKDEWDRYTDEVNPDAHLYVIDLASYGDLSMPEGYTNVHQVSGWSSNVIEFIDSFEQAMHVVREIEEIGPEDY